MEVVHGTCSKAAKFGTQEDIITRMPDNAITNIMDRLPIQDAVRTSVLSRIWRVKWTMLSQLRFDVEFYEYLLKKGHTKSFGKIISRILLNLNGTITKFTLQMFEECDFEDFNHWVLCLSRKGVKELSLGLETISRTPLTLPTHLFSCRNLIYLVVRKHRFPPMPTFHGFPNLLFLTLDKVDFESYNCGIFLSRCPLLKFLRITEDSLISEMGQAEFAKLGNLEFLDIPLCKFDNMAMTTSSGIVGLIGLLPKLQWLKLHFLNCKILADDGEKTTNAIPCLKNLELEGMDFSSANTVSCAYELIHGCENLQTLTIRMTCYHDFPLPAFSSSEAEAEANGRIPGKLQLQKVVLKNIKGSENEICLIKSILTCSPSLKKMDVFSTSCLVCNIDGNRIIKGLARKLLELQRAYPIVEIVLH